MPTLMTVPTLMTGALMAGRKWRGARAGVCHGHAQEARPYFLGSLENINEIEAIMSAQSSLSTSAEGEAAQELVACKSC